MLRGYEGLNSDPPRARQAPYPHILSLQPSTDNSNPCPLDFLWVLSVWESTDPGFRGLWTKCLCHSGCQAREGVWVALLHPTATCYSGNDIGFWKLMGWDLDTGVAAGVGGMVTWESGDNEAHSLCQPQSASAGFCCHPADENKEEMKRLHFLSN